MAHALNCRVASFPARIAPDNLDIGRRQRDLRAFLPLMELFLGLCFNEPVKGRRGVMPANAGIQNLLKILDPGVPRDDRKHEFQTFNQTVMF